MSSYSSSDESDSAQESSMRTPPSYSSRSTSGSSRRQSAQHQLQQQQRTPLSAARLSPGSNASTRSPSLATLMMQGERLSPAPSRSNGASPTKHDDDDDDVLSKHARFREQSMQKLQSLDLTPFVPLASNIGNDEAPEVRAALFDSPTRHVSALAQEHIRKGRDVMAVHEAHVATQEAREAALKESWTREVQARERTQEDAFKQRLSVAVHTAIAEERHLARAAKEAQDAKTLAAIQSLRATFQAQLERQVKEATSAQWSREASFTSEIAEAHESVRRTEEALHSAQEEARSAGELSKVQGEQLAEARALIASLKEAAQADEDTQRALLAKEAEVNALAGTLSGQVAQMHAFIADQEKTIASLREQIETQKVHAEEKEQQLQTQINSMAEELRAATEKIAQADEREMALRSELAEITAAATRAEEDAEQWSLAHAESERARRLEVDSQALMMLDAHEEHQGLQRELAAEIDEIKAAMHKETARADQAEEALRAAQIDMEASEQWEQEQRLRTEQLWSSKVSDLRASLTIAGDEHAALVADSNARLAESQQRLEQETRVREEAEQRIQQLNTEIASVREALSAAEQRSQELNIQLTATNTELDGVKESADLLTAQLESERHLAAHSASARESELRTSLDALHLQLDSARSASETLQLELHAQTELTHDAECQNLEMQERLGQAEKELEESRSACSDKDAQMESIRSQLAETGAQGLAASHELSSVRSELQAMKMEHEELCTEYFALEDESSRMENKLAHTCDMLDHFNATALTHVDQLKAAHAEQIAQMQAASAEQIAQAQEQVAEAQEQVAAITEQLAQAKEMHAQTMEQLEQVQEKLEQSHAQTASAEGDLSQAREEQESLRLQVSSLQARLAHTEMSLTQTGSAMADQLCAAQGQCSQLQVQQAALQAELLLSQQQYSQAQQDASAAQQQSATAAQRVSDALQELEERQEQLINEQQQLSLVKHQLAEAQQQLAEMEAELSRECTHSDALKNEHAKLQAEAEALQSTVVALQASEAQITQRATELSEKCSVAENRLMEAEQQAAEKEQLLQLATEQLKHSTEELASLRVAHDASLAQLASQQASLASAQESLARFESLDGAMATTLASRDAEIVSLRNEVSQFATELETERSQLVQEQQLRKSLEEKLKIELESKAAQGLRRSTRTSTSIREREMREELLKANARLAEVNAAYATAEGHMTTSKARHLAELADLDTKLRRAIQQEESKNSQLRKAAEEQKSKHIQAIQALESEHEKALSLMASSLREANMKIKDLEDELDARGSAAAPIDVEEENILEAEVSMLRRELQTRATEVQRLEMERLTLQGCIQGLYKVREGCATCSAAASTAPSRRTSPSMLARTQAQMEVNVERGGSSPAKPVSSRLSFSSAIKKSALRPSLTPAQHNLMLASVGQENIDPSSLVGGDSRRESFAPHLQASARKRLSVQFGIDTFPQDGPSSGRESSVTVIRRSSGQSYRPSMSSSAAHSSRSSFISSAGYDIREDSDAPGEDFYENASIDMLSLEEQDARAKMSVGAEDTIALPTMTEEDMNASTAPNTPAAAAPAADVQRPSSKGPSPARTPLRELSEAEVPMPPSSAVRLVLAPTAVVMPKARSSNHFAHTETESQQRRSSSGSASSESSSRRNSRGVSTSFYADDVEQDDSDMRFPSPTGEEISDYKRVEFAVASAVDAAMARPQASPARSPAGMSALSALAHSPLAAANASTPAKALRYKIHSDDPFSPAQRVGTRSSIAGQLAANRALDEVTLSSARSHQRTQSHPPTASPSAAPTPAAAAAAVASVAAAAPMASPVRVDRASSLPGRTSIAPSMETPSRLSGFSQTVAPATAATLLLRSASRGSHTSSIASLSPAAPVVPAKKSRALSSRASSRSVSTVVAANFHSDEDEEKESHIHRDLSRSSSSVSASARSSSRLVRAYADDEDDDEDASEPPAFHASSRPSRSSSSSTASASSSVVAAPATRPGQWLNAELRQNVQVAGQQRKKLSGGDDWRSAFGKK